MEKIKKIVFNNKRVIANGMSTGSPDFMLVFERLLLLGVINGNGYNYNEFKQPEEKLNVYLKVLLEETIDIWKDVSKYQKRQVKRVQRLLAKSNQDAENYNILINDSIGFICSVIENNALWKEGCFTNVNIDNLSSINKDDDTAKKFYEILAEILSERFR